MWYTTSYTRLNKLWHGDVLSAGVSVCVEVVVSSALPAVLWGYIFLDLYLF